MAILMIVVLVYRKTIIYIPNALVQRLLIKIIVKYVKINVKKLKITNLCMAI